MSFIDYNFRKTTPTGTFPSQIEPGLEPARVIDVILDDSHPDYKLYGGPASMGAIKYRYLTSNEDESETGEEKFTGIAYPLDLHQKVVPLKNEVVLIVEGPNRDIDTASPKGKVFYSTIYSLWNHPHHGAFPVKTDSPDVNIGEGIDEDSTIAPMQLFPGDFLLEGRLGQTLRFTGGLSAKSPWIDESNKNSPLIILSNGQKETKEGFTPIVEDINEDKSSIYLAADHTVNLTLANSKRASYETPPETPSNYKGAQVLLNSDRILLNSKQSDVLISSATSFGVNSNTVNIDGTDYACIDADKIYLGVQARVNQGAAKQPAVLGHRMEAFIQDVLSQLIAISKAMGSAKTVDGKSIPTINLRGNSAEKVLGELKNQLNPKGGSLLKSKKIFIE